MADTEFSFDPANGATDSSDAIAVPAGTNIRVRFSEPPDNWSAWLVIERNGFESREQLRGANQIVETAEGDDVHVAIQFFKQEKAAVSGWMEEVAK